MTTDNRPLSNKGGDIDLRALVAARKAKNATLSIVPDDREDEEFFSEFQRIDAAGEFSGESLRKQRITEEPNTPNLSLIHI